MELNLLFTVSSIYLALLGLGMLISPTTMMPGALISTSLVLIDIFRGIAGVCFGASIIDWAAPKCSEASNVRDAIILGNTIGFAFATVFGIFSIIQGLSMFQWIFVAIDVLLANGFFIVGISSILTLSGRREQPTKKM